MTNSPWKGDMPLPEVRLTANEKMDALGFEMAEHIRSVAKEAVRDMPPDQAISHYLAFLCNTIQMLLTTAGGMNDMFDMRPVRKRMHKVVDEELADE